MSQKSDYQEIEKTWDERAAGWEDQKETHRYAEQAFASIESLIPSLLGDWAQLRVLDFGCGTGLLTERLAPLCNHVVGLDLSSKMIAVLEEKCDREDINNVTPIAGMVRDPSVRGHIGLTAPFDLVVASSVCSFLPDFPSTLGVLISLLRPGGLFVQWDWQVDAAGSWAEGFTPEGIASVYEAALLGVVQIGTGFMFSFGGKEMGVLLGIGQRPGAT